MGLREVNIGKAHVSMGIEFLVVAQSYMVGFAFFPLTDFVICRIVIGNTTFI